MSEQISENNIPGIALSLASLANTYTNKTNSPIHKQPEWFLEISMCERTSE